MNNNNKYLSLGNIIKVIKELSNNKNVSQVDIFSSIFDINDINNTTVNNYCIGIRAIGIEFKNRFKKKYEDDSLLMNTLSIVSILDDKVYPLSSESIEIINNSKRLNEVINELIKICKKDDSVSKQFISGLNKLDNYHKFIELLNYAISDNKQPIYKQDINIKINMSELEDYLKIKLYYGQSYISSLIYLANKNNMYACAELGSLWFEGLVSGEVDYNQSFNYYKKAALKDHPKSCWMIANLILNKKVDYDESVMWKYLNRSIELGSAAGYNTLGLCYKRGIKDYDIDKAIHYFEISSEMGYVYAFNNLGKIYEDKNDIEESIKYYKISADMHESWALNKVGEYYRLKGDFKRAFIYYNESINSPINEICPYAYYNLSEYYYKNGNKELNIKKDSLKSKKYIELFNKLKKD